MKFLTNLNDKLMVKTMTITIGELKSKPFILNGRTVVRAPKKIGNQCFVGTIDIATRKFLTSGIEAGDPIYRQSSLFEDVKKIPAKKSLTIRDVKEEIKTRLSKLGIGLVEEKDNLFLRHELLNEKVIDYREYQVSIAMQALLSNSLVILPTGLGKTDVAIILSVLRLKSIKPSKILMLAPTKPLVYQHVTKFRETVKDLKIGALTGEVKKRKEIFEESDIIIATPQTIRNELMRPNRWLNLKDVSLLVIDEAHRTRKEYSYVDVAKAYKAESHYPLILGLTASPGSTLDKIKEIQETLDIKPQMIQARRPNDPDVLDFIHAIENKNIYFEPSLFEEISIPLNEIYRENLEELNKAGYIGKVDLKMSFKKLKDIHKALSEKIESIKETGGESDVFEYYSLATSAIILWQARNYIRRYGVEEFEKFLEREKKRETKAVERIFKHPYFDFVIAGIERYKKFSQKIEVAEGKLKNLGIELKELPKLAEIFISFRKNLKAFKRGNRRLEFALQFKEVKDLFEDEELLKIISDKNFPRNIKDQRLEALKEIINKNRDKKMIIFAEYRDSVDKIIKMIEKMGLKARKFIGQSPKEEEPGMTQDEQAETLEAFRHDEFNFLVASSVAEEGLDFDAPIVANHEPISDERRMIHRRGRTGRGGPGEVYVLIGKNTGDERIYSIAMRREKAMREIITKIKNMQTLI